jgi:hypothetical protein
MTEAEKAEQQAAAQADYSEADAGEDDDSGEDDDGGETPMIAVWLSLAAILVAGLYGLYLGTAAKSKQKTEAAATSSYVVPAPSHITGSAPRESAISGRHA